MKGFAQPFARRFATPFGLPTRPSSQVDPCADEPLFEDAGNVPVSTTFTHPVACSIEWIQTTLPTSDGTRITFRQAGPTDYVFVRTRDSDKSVSLWTSIGGTAAQIQAVTAVMAAGHKVVVQLDGTTIRVYSNGILRITQTVASFATATDGFVWTLGTGGAIADLKVWSPECAPDP